MVKLIAFYSGFVDFGRRRRSIVIIPVAVEEQCLLQLKLTSVRSLNCTIFYLFVIIERVLQTFNGFDVNKSSCYSRCSMVSEMR